MSIASVRAASSRRGDRFEATAPISRIYESDSNPRQRFDKDALYELASSIRLHGVLNPLTVREAPLAGGLLYQIIAGARRFRASQLAGRDTVPVIVKNNVSDALLVELQLIENLSRNDLNAMEEAQGYSRLIAVSGMTPT